MRIPGEDKWSFQAVQNLPWFDQRIILPDCDLRKADRAGRTSRYGLRQGVPTCWLPRFRRNNPGVVGLVGLVGHNAEVWSKQEGGKIYSWIMDWMKEHKGGYGPWFGLCLSFSKLFSSSQSAPLSRRLT
jgi:hypothetical protein